MGRHDMVQGIFRKWTKFLIPAALALLASLCFLWELSFVEDVTSTPTWMDHLCNLFSGMQPYDAASGSPFQVPVLYLVVNVFVAFTIGNYPVNDLYDYAPQLLIRTKNRARWWWSKCVWNITCVVLFYLVLFGVTAGMTLLTGGELTLIASQDVLTEFFGVTLEPVDNKALCLAVFTLPLLTSMAFSLTQMTMMFFLKPIYSYLSLVVLLVVSAYLMTPLMPGNYAMLWRNRIWLAEGISTTAAIAVDVFVSLTAIIIGYVCFQKKDILDKSESN